MSVDVFKPKGCKVWHYRFQVDGVRVQRSTRLREKGAAEQVATRAYANALERANGGHAVPTLGELFAEWEETRAPVASAPHRKAVDVVRRLHMYDLADLPLNALTTIRMEKARNRHLVDHKPASVNHWLRIMKLVVNWAVKRGIIARLPWQVDMLKVQKRPRAILPVEAAMAWFAEIDAATMRAPAVATAIRMMFGAGLREGEAAGARWEWLDWERGTYTPGVTKGREAEPIPLPEWLLTHLTPLRQQEGLIAARPDGTQFVAGFARAPMQAANRKCSTKGITPHRLRGSFATLLSENGANIQTIQAVMRHKSHITTMGYLEKDMGKVSEAQSNIAGKIGFSRQENGKQR
jgi:integrase